LSKFAESKTAEFTQNQKIKIKEKQKFGMNYKADKKALKANNVYKKLLFCAKSKGRCTFATSDFPSENPRTQTRNFPYTKPLATSANLNSEK
jgi:hypothetical protein